MTRDLAFASLLLAACSHGPTTPAPIKDPLVVHVTDVNGGIAGASVAVDVPAQGKQPAVRKEAVADPQGNATLALDASKLGTVVVTAYAPGHVVLSLLAVDGSKPVDVELPLGVTPNGTPVTGMLKNKLAVGDVVTLSASVPNQPFQDTTPTYQLTIERDAPYTMYGLEWTAGDQTQVSKRGVVQVFKRWASLDAPAPSTSSSVDFDFATAHALTPTDVKGSMVVPGGKSGPLATSIGYVTVGNEDGAFLGAPLSIDASADGTRFDFSLEHVQPDGVSHVRTTYVLLVDNTPVVGAHVAGYPADGASVDLIPQPVPTDKTLHLGDAPTVQPPDASVDQMWLEVRSVAAGQEAVVWRVQAPVGTPLAAPALPTAVDPSTALGSNPLVGRVVACANLQPGVGCARWSYSDSFGITE